MKNVTHDHHPRNPWNYYVTADLYDKYLMMAEMGRRPECNQSQKIRGGAPTKTTSANTQTAQQPHWEAQHATCCMLHSINAYLGARIITLASITRFIKEVKINAQQDMTT
jgi:hypothetical protein